MSATLFLTVLGACAQPAGDHGHAHGGHAHGSDSHGSAHEGGSIAITRWSDRHELFVALDAPVAGHPFSYRAHVTRLADNHAATSGVLNIRFAQDGFDVEAHTDEAVARPGLFAKQAMAPQKPGAYRLLFRYDDSDGRTEWDAGTVIVGDGVPHSHDGAAEGEITFRKESQWQVPFQIAPTTARPLAPTLTAAAMVQPAPGLRNNNV